MRNLVVEIISKEGVRIERVTLSLSELSIGRAWSNDIVVQDRFVDADHIGLSLNEQQQVVIADLSTANGSKLAGKHLNSEAKLYRLGDVLSIGDTRIKIFDADTAVAPAALRSKWFLFAERFSSVKAIMVLTAMALFAQVTQTYSASIVPLKIENYLVSAFGLLMLLLLWSLLLGFIAKLLRGESHIKPLWVLGCLAIIIANILTMTLLIVRFNLQDIGLGESLTVGLVGVFAIWLFVGVLSYITHLQNRSKWLCSFFVIGSLYAIDESDKYLSEPHQKWHAYTETEPASLPPAFLLRNGVSLDAYLEKTESLFDVE